MIKFLKSVVNFSLVLLTWMTINFIFNYYQLNRPVKIDADTLIIGDSHLRFGLDPELIPSSENVCIGAEPLLITHYKLKRILSDNPDIKTVLLGYSYNNFSAYQDEKLYGNRAKSQYNKYYSVLPLSLPNYTHLNEVKFYHTYVEKMLLYPNFKPWPFMGEHDKMKPNLENANLDAIMKRHYYIDDEVADISTISGQYLDSIISLTLDRKVKLFLISTPLRPEYIENTPDHIVNYWDEKTMDLRDKGVNILDYSKLDYPADHFHDHDHLSIIGTEKFSKEVLEKIASVN